MAKTKSIIILRKLVDDFLAEYEVIPENKNIHGVRDILEKLLTKNDELRRVCREHIDRYNRIKDDLTVSDKEKEQLRSALIQHRVDLHGRSNRPCGTCKQSADALGISVPDECARFDWDKKALEKRIIKETERKREKYNRIRLMMKKVRECKQ